MDYFVIYCITARGTVHWWCVGHIWGKHACDRLCAIVASILLSQREDVNMVAS